MGQHCINVIQMFCVCWAASSLYTHAVFVNIFQSAMPIQSIALGRYYCLADHLCRKPRQWINKHRRRPGYRLGQEPQITAVQRQTAVTAHFKSQQLLLFVFALHSIYIWGFSVSVLPITCLSYLFRNRMNTYSRYSLMSRGFLVLNGNKTRLSSKNTVDLVIFAKF